MMTNAELQAAIDSTHHKLSCDITTSWTTACSPPERSMMQEHLSELLKIQRERAAPVDSDSPAERQRRSVMGG